MSQQDQEQHDVSYSDTNDPCIGLGYRNENTNISTESSPSNHFVQALLKECLSYHHEQEIIRNNNTQNHDNSTKDDTYQVKPPPPIIQLPLPQPPLSSSSSSNGVIGLPITTAGPSVVASPQAILSSSSSSETRTVLEARCRAQQILQRFQNSSANNINETVSCETTTYLLEPNIGKTITTRTGTMEAASPTTTINYVQQRQIGFQREQQRMRNAMIKNLQYILSKQEKKLNQLNSNITNSTQQLESIIQDKHSNQYDPKLLHKQSSNFGSNFPLYQSDLPLLQQLSKSYHDKNINKNENDNPRSNASNLHKDRTTTSAQTSTSTTLALYIHTIPKITSSSSSLYWKESYIEQLFKPYGTIRNVYLYRNNKQQQQQNASCCDDDHYYKGDGLVIFKIDNNRSCSNNDAEKAESLSIQQQELALLELVCGQVRFFPSSNFLLYEHHVLQERNTIKEWVTLVQLFNVL
jgi:hypothetical protein